MAKIYLHSIVKELAGRSEIELKIDRPTALRDVLLANFNERELFLIVDETGAIRRHINIFADGARLRTSDSVVDAGVSIDIFPAVSGG